MNFFLLLLQKLDLLANLVAFVVIPITVMFALKWGWQLVSGKRKSESRRQLEAQRSWSDGLRELAAVMPHGEEELSEEQKEEEARFVIPVTPVSARRSSSKKPRAVKAKKTPAKTPVRTPRRVVQSETSPAQTRASRATRSASKSRTQTKSKSPSPKKSTEKSPRSTSRKPVKQTPVKKSASKKQPTSSTKKKRGSSTKKMPRELIDILENQEQFFHDGPPTPGSRRQSMRLRNK